jgi:hypothetical protein
LPGINVMTRKSFPFSYICRYVSKKSRFVIFWPLDGQKDWVSSSQGDKIGRPTGDCLLWAVFCKLQK